MKKLNPAIYLVLMTALVCLFPCCKGRKVSSERVAYSEDILSIDSLRWLTGGPEYPDDMPIDSDTLKYVWTGFAELYSEGKYQEAYDFLKEEQRYQSVLIYLRNSTAQYEFVSKVWSVCVSAHAGSEEDYYKEIGDEYSQALLHTKNVIEMGGKDPYIPPHYMNMVMEYGRLILAMKDYEKAETFNEEIYFAAKSMYGDERLARFLGLTFRCPYLCRVGQEDQAHRELEVFRQEAKWECSKEELEKLLPAIDATERDMTNSDSF